MNKLAPTYAKTFCYILSLGEEVVEGISENNVSYNSHFVGPSKIVDKLDFAEFYKQAHSYSTDIIYPTLPIAIPAWVTRDDEMYDNPHSKSF